MLEKVAALKMKYRDVQQGTGEIYFNPDEMQLGEVELSCLNFRYCRCSPMQYMIIDHLYNRLHAVKVSRRSQLRRRANWHGQEPAKACVG